MQIFLVFALTRLGIERRSTVLEADALSTRPLIGLLQVPQKRSCDYTVRIL